MALTGWDVAELGIDTATGWGLLLKSWGVIQPGWLKEGFENAEEFAHDAAEGAAGGVLDAGVSRGVSTVGAALAGGLVVYRVVKGRWPWS